jgi:hypothetical protein
MFIPNETQERWEKYYDTQGKTKAPSRTLTI